MKKIVLFFIALFLVPFSVNAKEISIHLFYGKDCPHCKAEIKYIDKLLLENENLNLYKYEVTANEENRNRFKEIQNLLETKSRGIPYLVIGNQVLMGYLEGYTDENIEEIIDYYEKNDYRDIVGEKLGVSAGTPGVELENKKIIDRFNVPLLGEINPKTVSLPLIAAIIGFVDGFNPCAMWILLFLIAMMFNLKDRKKMWILGLTFIISSGLIYLLFMISWLNLSSFVSKVSIIRWIVGAFAIVFGGINLRNYMKSKKKPTGCEVVNDKKRTKIMDKIKKIVSEKSYFIAVIGIILLAISVNVIELMCSLGLPLIFSQILALNNLSIIEYIILLGVYIIFFLIDDIIIFAIAMKTTKIKGISNKYTKYSHLVGGLIMIIMGLLMIFKPAWLMFNF